MGNEGIIKKLVSSVKCAVCGQCYDKDGINILGHQDDVWFLNVSCSTCHTQCLVAAVIKAVEAPEVITDLTEIEQGRPGHMDMVTGDEVLDMHNFLKHFDGDFSRIFSHK